MPAFFLLFINLLRTIRRAFDDAEFRSLLNFVFLIITAGTFFYHAVEGWRWLDALYFSVVTLTTVGYGDLAPKTDAGKLFTIIYILVGLGAFTAFITALAGKQRERIKRISKDVEAH